MNSVLAKVTPADLTLDPFPYLAVPDALDEALCTQLIAEYPPLPVLTGGASYQSNQRFSYGAHEALANPDLPRVWRELIETHTSQAFLDELIALFGDAIRAEYPSVETKLGPLAGLRAGRRRRDDFANADVLLDAQVCVNTPVVGEPSSVRKGHVDRFDKLFAGLLYLRPPEDDSVGGDLELYRPRGGTPVFRGKSIEDRYLETIRTVRYERNVLFLFLNCRSALHGVSARSPTTVPRYFFNLAAEVRDPLFDLDAHQAPRTWAQKLARAPRKLRRLIPARLSTRSRSA